MNAQKKKTYYIKKNSALSFVTFYYKNIFTYTTRKTGSTILQCTIQTLRKYKIPTNAPENKPFTNQYKQKYCKQKTSIHTNKQQNIKCIYTVGQNIQVFGKSYNRCIKSCFNNSAINDEIEQKFQAKTLEVTNYNQFMFIKQYQNMQNNLYI